VLARASAVLVRSLIWGVQPTDPLTFAGAALLGLTVATVAVVIPTIRVLSLNPIEALRHS
jgi:ABC-type lipoprotein release transport system permease subunit